MVIMTNKRSGFNEHDMSRKRYKKGTCLYKIERTGYWNHYKHGELLTLEEDERWWVLGSEVGVA